MSVNGLSALTSTSETKIAVIGLGYVGLPLAVEFGAKYDTVGFDTNPDRITELKNGHDATREVPASDFKKAVKLTYSDDVEAIRGCNVYVVTVPTPIDEANQPNLTPLVRASETIGQVISKGDVVIYESTVYPGATEEVCVPVIEKESGYVYNQDFFAGYSPERINPGDKAHRLPTIQKVTSGSTPETALFVDELYASIITAGTHKASSIAVAEAAKVIENTQRDVNIALINELALIFQKLNIDTHEVLEAAGTKWNFLPFRPGLVGGHCIGVDPYYLTHKAQEVGYHPDVILAGRRINDNMGAHIADRVVKLMAKSAINLVGARVLILGLAFKENCPDIRNTKVVDIYRALQAYHLNLDVYDPWVDPEDACQEYGIKTISSPRRNAYDAVILAVAHDEFKALTIAELTTDNHVVFDVKSMLPREQVTERL